MVGGKKCLVEMTFLQQVIFPLKLPDLDNAWPHSLGWVNYVWLLDFPLEA